MNNIFEEVKGQLNIQQVIEHYGFKVNRARQFVCPFHNDHKPSASIKNDYFHCFVCGAGGDLITFTAKYLGLSNLEACKELVREFNLDIDIRTQEEIEKQYLYKRKRQQEQKKADKKEYSTRKEAFFNSRKTEKINKTKLKSERKKDILDIEKKREEYINHIGIVLAEYHYFLWRGIQEYPFEHERHIKGLQELTECQFYIDFYNYDAILFYDKCKGVINEYERQLDSINKQR